jgi:translation initiation factor IF-2
MPVRIYDIAKKLGIESKEVLAKAKELGIAAKVPSSSLDKITAEYLEGHFAPVKPPEPEPPLAPPPQAVAVAPPLPEAPIDAGVEIKKSRHPPVPSLS